MVAMGMSLDVDLLLADQIQQQVERAVVVLEMKIQGRWRTPMAQSSIIAWRRRIR